ncbi:spermidine synthase [Microlunatus speluncae]|uniref:spermidine synthase n=1 Tax=Microlunatus speluncae TaxID=2594267 RepID=UPI0012663CCE|nr:fused MFS/spermidine synthase [Microlunatus speluncae]
MGFTDQSYVDLDDPLRLEFDYIQRIADAVDAHALPGKRLRVVHVGGAAMTLPRYVAATRPTSAQIVLEPDQELTSFVRQHLPLDKRSGIKVRAADGRTGVAELRDDYADLIIVDAFVGARVPAELGTAEFFADTARVLVDDGTVMINITDRSPLGYARRVLAAIRTAFPETVFIAESSTLKGRRFGNILILGSPLPLPVGRLAERAGSAAFPYRVVHGDRLDQLAGAAEPYTDAYAEESPAPPDGLTHFS